MNRSARPHVTAAVVGPAVATVGLGALATLTGSTWLLLLSCGGVALVVASALLRPRLEDLSLCLHGDERVAVGESVRHRVHVHNRGTRASAPLLLTHHLRGLDDVTVHVPGLAPGARSEFELTRRAASRGVAETVTFRLESRSPIGLVTAGRDVVGRQRLVVHPQVVEPLRPRARSGTDDEAVDPRPGAGLDIAQVRDWRPGDDPRRVHWRSTARRGRLVVAERGSGPARALDLLVVGPSEAPDWEDLVALAAATTRAAHVQGRPVTVTAWAQAGPSPATLGGSTVALLDWWAGLTEVLLPAPDQLVAAAGRLGPAHEVTVVASRHLVPAWWTELRAHGAAAGLHLTALGDPR